NVIANLAQIALVQQPPAVRLDRGIVSPQLLKNSEVEARYPRRLQKSPGYSVLGVESDLDLLVVIFKHPLYRFEIDRCVHDLPFMGLLKNIPWFFRNRWFFRTLCEDYTPKSTVAQSRPIPLSFVPFSGLSGVFPASGQGIP